MDNFLLYENENILLEHSVNANPAENIHISNGQVLAAAVMALQGITLLCGRFEGVEAALAIASQSDVEVAKEAGDVLYHLLVALRSRGVPLDAVAKVLADRQGASGIAEKASRTS